MVKRDVVTAREAAEIAGVSATSFRAYVYRDQAPKPEPGFDPETGQKVWSRKTIINWAANRPGRGARTDLHGKGWTQQSEQPEQPERRNTAARTPAPRRAKAAPSPRPTAQPPQTTRKKTPVAKKSVNTKTSTKKKPAPE